MAGAFVALLADSSKPALRNTLCDEKGNFMLLNVKDGHYSLRITSVNSKDFYVPDVLVTSGNSGPIQVVLVPKENQLTNVSIVYRRPVIQQKIDMTVVNVDESVRKEAPNALEILRLAPGVLVSDNEDEVSLAGKETVQIMLNGRKVRLTGRDLLKLLKSIPASSVSQLEVMSNPSSKYDVRGNTAILNIRTKKGGVTGFTGNVAIESSQSEHNMGDYSTTLNYGTGKLNFSSYIAYHNGTYKTSTEEIRQIGSNPNDQLVKNYSGQQSWSDPVLRLQGDYYISPRHTIGMLVEMEKSTNKEWYHGDARIFSTSPLDSSVLTENYYPNTRKWNTYNFNYRFNDTLGNEFNFDWDRSYFNKNEQRYLNNTVSSNGHNEVLPNAYLDIRTIDNITTWKGDYSRPFPGGVKLEAGFKFSYVTTHNDYLAKHQINNGMYVDSNLTNNFYYRENIHAAYANLGKTWNKWGAQVGLRLEQSDIKGISTDVKGGAVNKPDSSYTNLMPSAFVSFVPSQNHAFRLSFIQQIKRPDYEALRPFNYQIDLFYYYQGNPALRVQSNYNGELSYTYKSKTTVTASYNYTRNYFNTVNYSVGPILYESVQNTGIAKDFTLAVSKPLKITKWWTSNNKASAFYNYFRGQIYDGYLNGGGWGYSAYTSQRFVIHSKYVVTLTGRYTSATHPLFYAVANQTSFNISAGRKLFKDKSVLKIGMNDIFRMQSRDVTVDFASLHYTQHNTWESRRVFIEFSYKFGSAKIKGVRDRETGNGDERSRAGK